MNRTEYDEWYCWGDNFSAVGKPLANSGKMYFILPDENISVDELLVDNELWSFVNCGGIWSKSKKLKINLSVPKFDVSSTVNLKDGLNFYLRNEVFDMENSEFPAITSDSPVYVAAVNQSARVEIDENGVKAAAYIEFPGAGAAQPPEEIIDFVLDRPFVFVISKGNLPLFTGVVNNM